MQQWEYLCVEEDGPLFTSKWEGEKDLMVLLNKKGKEGWELVQGPSYQSPNLIFKRPKQ